MFDVSDGCGAPDRKITPTDGPPPYIGKVMVIVVPSFSLLLKAIVP